MTNWTAVTESPHPWEREALDFVRQRFPSHEPWRAWSNFEFLADDGSINEIDLFVLSPEGVFVIEIKSRPGRLFGDAGTWTWETEGKLRTVDSPLYAANLKAKKLRTLLERQKVVRKKGPLPFFEALVFCSAADLRLELSGLAASRICLRDRDAADGIPARAGILAAIGRRDCPGLDPNPRGVCDRPTARLMAQAVEQAGIRPCRRQRKVADLVLENLVAEGPGYQDWLATHVKLTDVKRRVRLYLVRAGNTEADRQMLERAALREFQLLETLQHPGVLRAYGCTEHDLGWALVFDYDPVAVRLDHFLAERKGKLATHVQLDLLRQIAEVVRFAHEKKVVHRALSPQSILVSDSGGPRPRLRVFNWQVGYRIASTTSAVSRQVTVTAHVDRLIEDTATAYMAPEALTSTENTGEHLDVFSLGVIAYHLFSGESPAANAADLSNRIRDRKGLQLSAVLNGAPESLQYLIQYATHPDVSTRTDSVAEFLSQLEDVEEEFTSPDVEIVDPTDAKKDEIFPGGYRVEHRLGRGACSVAYLVEREGQKLVLKVAHSPDLNPRLKDEGEVLRKLRHQHIVECLETLTIGDRTCLLLERAGEKTLGQRLREEGRLTLEFLQRFGEDLLDVVKFLEEQGIQHRDIKPDNIGVGPVGRGDKPHLILFDFSLSRTPPDNIRAGTVGYLDPMLPLRKRWDLHAERYAVAATLYELATGTLPKWGDGTSDPSHLDCEVTIESELFDAGVRDSLTEFFGKAFRRDVAHRFDNAEVMLRAWREAFEGIDTGEESEGLVDEAAVLERMAGATHETPIQELGMGTRATNALDRANILTAGDLLTTPLNALLRLRGVGSKTRAEISRAVRLLRRHLQSAEPSTSTGEDLEAELGTQDHLTIGIDGLARLLCSGRAPDADRKILHALLGIHAETTQDSWPSQADVGRALGVSRQRIGQVYTKALTRWAKSPSITAVRDLIVDILAGEGNVAVLDEVVSSFLTRRGSMQEEPLRSRQARAVLRAAAETERSRVAPRFLVSRLEDRILVGTTPDLAGYARYLGVEADRIAGEDPLLPPVRVLERLRAIFPPSKEQPLSDARLVRVAVAASTTAALSSRQEIYPRGMEAGRAIKLSQGALLGVRELTVAQIGERVRSRYPEAQPLLERPALDDLLARAGLELRWDEQAVGSRGAYVTSAQEIRSLSTGSSPASRQSTTFGPLDPHQVTPEVADAREFEERLHRSIQEGAFLALIVPPRNYLLAQDELSRRFPVQVVDLDGLLIRHLKQECAGARVKWEVVLQTDASREHQDWPKLELLVSRIVPRIEQELAASDRTLLLVYAGLLARYRRMDLLERLRDRVGRKNGLPGAWVLVPGDAEAVIDGQPIPLLSRAQRARIPESWVQNRHRSGVKGAARP